MAYGESWGMTSCYPERSSRDICLEPIISKTVCYLATIANYYIPVACSEAVRLAILATA